MGIINIQQMYGIDSVIAQKNINLVIELENWITASSTTGWGLNEELGHGTGRETAQADGAGAAGTESGHHNGGGRT